MELHQAQDKIAEDLHRFRVLCCGRRFGKTTLAIEEIKGIALCKSTKSAYIATTYVQARDIAWEMLKKEMAGAVIQANESRLELRIKNQKGTESLIMLRGWENIETLRGMAFDFIVIDEVASMRNFWLNWQEVIRPTLTDTKGEGLFISTPQGFNHFYDLYNLELKDKDFKSFHFTSYDNPFIPKEEIDKAKQEITEDRFAQEYLADFRKTEGLVFKEFDRTKHIYTDLPVKSFEKISGVDFGYTNPVAVLDIRSYHNEEYWIENELYRTGMTDAAVAEYVKACNFDAVYPDPESPAAIKEMTNKKINVRPVLKTKDSIKTGIQKIRELLLANKLHINARCLNTIQEFETYVYDNEKGDKDLKEKPLKLNDHAIDALRYVILMRMPQIKIKEYIQPPYEDVSEFALKSKRTYDENLNPDWELDKI